MDWVSLIQDRSGDEWTWDRFDGRYMSIVKSKQTGLFYIRKDNGEDLAGPFEDLETAKVTYLLIG